MVEWEVTCQRFSFSKYLPILSYMPVSYNNYKKNPKKQKPGILWSALYLSKSYIKPKLKYCCDIQFTPWHFRFCKHFLQMTGTCHKNMAFFTFRQSPIFRSTSSDLYGLESPCYIHKVESVTTLYSNCKEEVLLWQWRAWVLLWTPYYYSLYIKVLSLSIILLTSYITTHSVTL